MHEHVAHPDQIEGGIRKRQRLTDGSDDIEGLVRVGAPHAAEVCRRGFDADDSATEAIAQLEHLLADPRADVEHSGRSCCAELTRDVEQDIGSPRVEALVERLVEALLVERLDLFAVERVDRVAPGHLAHPDGALPHRSGSAPGAIPQVMAPDAPENVNSKSPVTAS